MSDVDAICSFNGELYAGGWFNETNGSDHNFLARYAELNSVGKLSDKVEFKFFPNPTHSYTNFSFVLRERAELSIDIMDSQGRIVKTLGTKMFDQGEQQILLDLTDIIHGIYFVKVGINDNVYFEQIVKLQD
ncbi:MAG: T9SS type A sorting domain-containing protein [Crocinitomicaceae bacterium]|nr:T9SS type A sorting domain-containing protein [Crocinitomicaceae bacterium]